MNRKELPGEFSLLVANGMKVADALDWYAAQLGSLMMDAQKERSRDVVGCAAWLIAAGE